MTNLVMFVEDGLTGKNLITLNLDIIQDIDVITTIIDEIIENNHIDEKHNIIIKYGFKPI